MIILAALDGSVAARPVLGVASRVAALLGAGVEAVHVGAGNGGEVAAAIADEAHVPFHAREGDIVAELGSAARERDAMALVIGARDT